MLRIINNLEPFFNDCYRRINVREYAKVMKISPPTASKLLDSLEKEGFLEREDYRNYIFYYANKNSRDFIDLSRIYWRNRLKELVEHIEKNSANPTIILFGSLSKAEVKADSDIDLAIISQRKRVPTSDFEKRLGRTIQTFVFDSFSRIKPKELRNNIINGYVITGRLEV